MSIEAIDRKAVHQICSGQVVLNLAVAVKELLENSLDAGATCIEIRLKDYGSQLLEVVDNGCGVHPSDYEALALKHYTSKLKDFSDLTTVATFGFRGEALSSLCALSDLVVSTCHKSSTVGDRLEYDKDGHIKARCPLAREVGTTVSLQNLFHTLPVRYKEFQHNLKREYARMTQVVQGYCLISTHVRISCYNQAGSGAKQLVLSTFGNATTKDNIINVFGPKQLGQLVEMEQCLVEEVDSEDQQELTEESLKLFRLSGYVSRCNHGCGRSSTDRQFYFFNNRPCDHPKLVKVVNTVYRMFNQHQYPFVVLNVHTNRELVDVNLTPDKRQVMVHHENALLLLVKGSLMKLFKKMEGQIDSHVLRPHLQEHVGRSGDSVSQALGNTHTSVFTQALVKRARTAEDSNNVDRSSKPKQTRLSALQGLKYSPLSRPSNYQDQNGLSGSSSRIGNCWTGDWGSSAPIDAGGLLGGGASSVEDGGEAKVGTGITRAVNLDSPMGTHTLDSPVGTHTLDSPMGTHTLDSPVGTHTLDSLMGTHTLDSPMGTHTLDSPVGTHTLDSPVGTHTLDSPVGTHTLDSLVGTHTLDSLMGTHTLDSLMGTHTLDSPVGTHTLDSSMGTQRPSHDAESSHAGTQRPSCDSGGRGPGSQLRLSGVVPTEEVDCFSIDPPTSCVQYDDMEPLHKRLGRSCNVTFNLNDTLERARAKPANLLTCTESRSKFMAQISPNSNMNAEEELRREIRDMFACMEVIGQFNLGFIICKLNKDLFIVDQHASDEKYNFERLSRDTVIEHQSLLCPRPLELTATGEMVVMDNLHVFTKNGFLFEIDANALPMKRVKLTAHPVSKNWTFGPSDIDELVFMLTDSPGEMVRLPRVTQMFASRACRSSVMVGTSLTKAEMKKILVHMSELKHPWNCPHGRPTMRHLFDLSRI